MDNFLMNVQVEELFDCDFGCDEVITAMSNEVRFEEALNQLCDYGKQVGFTSINFRYACEESYVNANRDLIERLLWLGVESAETFATYVRGYALGTGRYNATIY